MAPRINKYHHTCTRLAAVLSFSTNRLEHLMFIIANLNILFYFSAPDDEHLAMNGMKMRERGREGGREKMLEALLTTEKEFRDSKICKCRTRRKEEEEEEEEGEPNLKDPAQPERPSPTGAVDEEEGKGPYHLAEKGKRPM
ncbi:hypothetical protein OIU85_011769 [Salix viminalis]|uniref:Uncharacterized protein n=1 Tax=Salix viminalis TaxID=40686 RepID=A0A9Q0SFZ0_SALVM|nr:hypothetical protein OIU85_011769 [Salix viminalis]